ncbi:MAG TPA: methylated-DNA--[protein]-cysteine S-methyltransferase [Nitrospiria bacterium]
MKFSLFSTPLGPLGVVRSHKGLCRIDFHPGSTIVFKEKVASLYGEEPFHDPRGFMDLGSQISAYFEGSLEGFKIPLDFSALSAFHERVLLTLRTVPFGQTLSYSSLAIKSGHPKAFRAVGTACARNPLPLVIPCHRVIGKNRKLGGFSGGLEIKRRLLRHEGSKFIE